MVTKPYSIQQKRNLISEFKSGKESMKAFAKRKHMSPSTLRRWLNDEAPKDDNLKKENFGIIHLQTSEEQSKESEYSEEICFKCDKIEIRLKKGYKLIVLQKIFEVLSYVK